jgi:hypothetical protein
MTRYVLIAVALLALTACTQEKQTVLKSPCAGAAESPCGPKRYVNG